MREYTEDYDQASALLRQVLALLGRHHIPPDPRAYAVFYDYLAGTDEGLRRAVDERLARGGWNAEDTRELFERFVHQHDSQVVTAVHSGLRKILQDLLERVLASASDFADYAINLDDFSRQLHEVGDRDLLASLTGDMVAHTRGAQASNSALQEQVEDTSEEVAALRAELARVRRQARTDPLTGLANRKAFDESLAEWLAQSVETGEPLSLLLVDIDDFKSFNDDFGHLVGDKVLKFIAATLTEQVKGRDVAARFGGEEFAVILPETGHEGAEKLAEQIRSVIERSRVKRPEHEELVRKVTVSVGLATSVGGDACESLIERADAALYRAKRDGRNRIRRD